MLMQAPMERLVEMVMCFFLRDVTQAYLKICQASGILHPLTRNALHQLGHFRYSFGCRCPWCGEPRDSSEAP